MSISAFVDIKLKCSQIKPQCGVDDIGVVALGMMQQNIYNGCKCTGDSDCISTEKDRAVILAGSAFCAAQREHNDGDGTG